MKNVHELTKLGAVGDACTRRPADHAYHGSLIGHGQAVNELKFHTLDPNLLLSMSAGGLRLPSPRC
jgi:hypothetical protein